MKHLCLLTLVALTFDLGQNQELESIPYSWLPDKFPNPQITPRDCGLGDNKGYVCDPNTILTRNQLKTLNWFLEGIANTINTNECPCSRYFCENNEGQRFYKVAVALIPRLRIPRNTDGKEMTVLDQANAFAYRLEHDVWNISRCEEDIVILYSQDDKALVTMTGRTAGRKLNSLTRKIIHGMVGRHFSEGRINEGLERMVYEIELVLNGKREYHGASDVWGTDSGHMVGSSLVFLLLAVGASWLPHSLTAS